jgi:hypothetical protein
MSQHAILSPSGAEKWMNCPGSVAMEKGLPDSANDYSDEGTAAHLLGSTCLEQACNPAAYVGETINVGSTDDFDGAVWGAAPAGFITRRTYVVDDEMALQVAKYVDKVREYAANGGTAHAEQRISISTFTGEEDAAGTSDAVVTRPGELTVIDLKYGMGVRVDATENKQLMIYALGVREEMDFAYGPFERIRFVISQPRLDHLSEWDCSSAELDAFAETVSAAAGEALAVFLERPEDVAQHLHPGEKTCRWCKAKATCPALAKFVTDTMAADFEVIAEMGEPKPTYDGGDALAEELGTDYGPVELSSKMAAIPLIEDWCKAIRAKVEQQLFAGVAIPGWKLVMGKKGNRAWRDVEAADALLKQMRLKAEERYKMTLLSPTQIEKALKATPKRLARLMKADLIGQTDGTPSVAPESDKREAWTQPDTSKDFTADEETIA